MDTLPTCQTSRPVASTGRAWRDTQTGAMPTLPSSSSPETLTSGFVMSPFTLPRSPLRATLEPKRLTLYALSACLEFLRRYVRRLSAPLRNPAAVLTPDAVDLLSPLPPARPLTRAFRSSPLCRYVRPPDPSGSTGPSADELVCDKPVFFCAAQQMEDRCALDCLLSVSEVNLTDHSSLLVQSTGGLGTLSLLLRSRMG